MQRFVSYLRVSTTRQGASGLGLEAQREHVRQYIARCGGELIEEFVEVESGGIRDRPGLVKSIARCRERKAVLLIAKLDRLARSVAFVSSLMEAGTEFVAVDMPFANKLMVHLMAAFAEHERTEIGARTKAALAAAKARGVVLGKNGRLLALKNKDAAARWAEQLRFPVALAQANGARTYRGVAAALNAADYRTREGCLWSAGTVQRLMIRLSTSSGDSIDQTGKLVCDGVPGSLSAP